MRELCRKFAGLLAATPRGYGLSFLASLLAVGLTILISPLTQQTPFMLFVAAVVVSAWYGGLGPGLVATIISMLASSYLIFSPAQSFDIALGEDRLRLGLFLLVAILINSSSILRKRAEERATEHLQQEQAARAEAEATARRLRAVQTITDAALAHLTLDDLLHELLVRISQALNTDTAAILLVSEDGARLRLRASYGLGIVSESLELPIGDGVDGSIALSTQPIIVNDLSTVQVKRAFQREKVKSMMGVPLHIEGRVIGVADVGTFAPCSFTEEDLQLLQVVADRAVSAIERVRLFEQVRSGMESLRVLSQRLMEAQEAERRHIARELHDEIGQALTILKLDLETASEQMHQSAPSADFDLGMARIQEGIVLLERTLGQVRRLSRELHPAVLEDLGLVSGLRWLVDRMARSRGIELQFSADSLASRLTPEIEIACFRIAQEALTNIARHARARQGQVELRQSDGMIVVSVADDGIGFDVQTARQGAALGTSLGLLGMQERVQAVGGTLEIESNPEHGTLVRARFPAKWRAPSLLGNENSGNPAVVRPL